MNFLPAVRTPGSEPRRIHICESRVGDVDGFISTATAKRDSRGYDRHQNVGAHEPKSLE
jgi:hypothetical protein